MPKSLNKDQQSRLDALNSTVVFPVMVTSARNPVTGKAILDADKMTDDTTVTMAVLIGNADKKPWLSASGGDQDEAFEKVIARAQTTDRPASTASQLQEELRTTQEELARTKAEMARIRSGAESGSVEHFSGNQDRQTGSQKHMTSRAPAPTPRETAPAPAPAAGPLVIPPVVTPAAATTPPKPKGTRGTKPKHTVTA